MKKLLFALTLLTSCGKEEITNTYQEVIERSYTETIYLSYPLEKIQTNANIFLLDSQRCEGARKEFKIRVPSKTIKGACRDGYISETQDITSANDKVECYYHISRVGRVTVVKINILRNFQMVTTQLQMVQDVILM